ncbi:type I-MYXAN CRISPR-associated protein Cas6/Cmx6 [Leptolyngbya sp. FACHB-1515]|uniref:type I-MYXAN CRISPR-associated protein Cas6/Cmx6 n=1 Tax=Leptolyngbya sp. FACHB-1515 TaxID=2933931 RepID=UPI003297F7F8
MPYVELSFRVMGQALPADHGYGLYSAIAHLCPGVHEQEGLSILTIPGKPDHQGKIALTRQSHLKIRLPSDKIMLVLPLAGQKLMIGTHEIQLFIPQVAQLQPIDKLRSRLVTIKGFQEPGAFLEAAQRQLDALKIQGHLSIPLNLDGELSRKTIKIKSYSVVGFALEIINLSDDDSIKLQTLGLGGKRRMGCGIFTPFPYSRRFNDA